MLLGARAYRALLAARSLQNHPYKKLDVITARDGGIAGYPSEIARYPSDYSIEELQNEVTSTSDKTKFHMALEELKRRATDADVAREFLQNDTLYPLNIGWFAFYPEDSSAYLYTSGIDDVLGAFVDVAAHCGSG